jgi:hypothetical protein
LRRCRRRAIRWKRSLRWFPSESFRAEIEAVVLTPEEAKKSKAGRKPLDALVLFRMLVLQALYNLSDTFASYGEVAAERQRDIIRELAQPMDPDPKVQDILKQLMRATKRTAA